MLFRPTIGTWCKDTTNLRGAEKVAIAMTCNLLATYLQLTYPDHKEAVILIFL